LYKKTNESDAAGREELQACIFSTCLFFFGKQENIFGLKNLSVVNKTEGPFKRLILFFSEEYTSTPFVPFPIILCKLVVGGI
jgi:hypothetical protein